MTMSESTLADELETLTPEDAEAPAITNLVNAYSTYATDAESNAVQISAAGITLGKAAMAPALVGMSAPGAGLTKIPAAVIAFWAAAAIPASFSGSVGATPPSNSGLAALLADTFPANALGEKSLEDSAAAIAADMDPQAKADGIALFPPPPAGTSYDIE